MCRFAHITQAMHTLNTNKISEQHYADRIDQDGVRWYYLTVPGAPAGVTDCIAIKHGDTLFTATITFDLYPMLAEDE